MKKLIFILMVGCLFSQSGETTKMELSEHLKPLQSYIGKTFKGEFADSIPANLTYDIQHWERALNGNAIKITHSVNNGEYGGESMIKGGCKSRKSSILVFHYGRFLYSSHYDY